MFALQTHAVFVLEAPVMWVQLAAKARAIKTSYVVDRLRTMRSHLRHCRTPMRGVGLTPNVKQTVENVKPKPRRMMRSALLFNIKDFL